MPLGALAPLGFNGAAIWRTHSFAPVVLVQEAMDELGAALDDLRAILAELGEEVEELA